MINLFSIKNYIYKVLLFLAILAVFFLGLQLLGAERSLAYSAVSSIQFDDIGSRRADNFVIRISVTGPDTVNPSEVFGVSGTVICFGDDRSGSKDVSGYLIGPNENFGTARVNCPGALPASVGSISITAPALPGTYYRDFYVRMMSAVNTSEVSEQRAVMGSLRYDVVLPPQAANIINFQADPDVVDEGNTTDLDWTTTGDISTCAVDDTTNSVSFTGYGANDGFTTTPLPVPSVDYELTCFATSGNPADDDTAFETVIVNPLGLPTPWVDVECGGMEQVWTCSTGEYDLVGNCAADEMLQIRSAQQCAGTVTADDWQCVPDASCGGGGGGGLPSITSFSINGGASATIDEGQTATLFWNVTSGISCDIAGAETLNNINLPSDSTNTNSGLMAAGSPYTYTLECDDGSGGLITRSVSLIVNAPVACDWNGYGEVGEQVPGPCGTDYKVTDFPPCTSSNEGDWETSVNFSSCGGSPIIIDRENWQCQCGAPTVFTSTVSIVAIPQQVYERRSATIIWNAVDVLGACTLSKQAEGEASPTDIDNTNYTYAPATSYNSGALVDSNSYITLPITREITYTATCQAASEDISSSVTVNPFKLKIEEN